MYFGLLPPEVNSGLMYAGPGSESMIAAATAWDGLSAQLYASAAAYTSVLSGLRTVWRGPSSMAMATAAAPLVAWLTATAVQAEQTAAHVRAATTAYETAFAATVPPAVVEANRSELRSLVSTNVFGQNTPAIAANEARYGRMWARDASAMSTYAAQSAAATRVTPFSSPPSVINPGGSLGQVLQTLAASFSPGVGYGAQAQFSELFGAVPSLLHSLGTIVSGPNPASSLLTALNDFAGLQTLSSVSADVEAVPKLILPANSALINTIMGVVVGTKGLEGTAPGQAAVVAGGADFPDLGGTVSAGVGRAGLVAGMSVPPSWATATPAIRTVASVLSSAAHNAVPAAAVSEGTLLSGMVAGMAGSAFGAALPDSVCGDRARLRCMSLKNGASKDSESPADLQRLVADMAANPDEVQHWYTDGAQLESLIEKLKKKPGIHAVHLADGDPHIIPAAIN